MEAPKNKMYTFVLRQLSPLDKGIQSAHAVVEYCDKYRDEKNCSDWISQDKTLIVLNGGTSEDLKEIKSKLEEFGLPYSEFKEPDLENITTAIAVCLNEVYWNDEKYPTYENWCAKKKMEFDESQTTCIATYFGDCVVRTCPEFIQPTIDIWFKEVFGECVNFNEVDESNFSDWYDNWAQIREFFKSFRLAQ